MKINQMLYDDKVLLKPSDYAPKDSYTDFYCDNTYCSGACEFDWENSINSPKDDKQYPSHPLFIRRDKIHKLRKNYKVNLPEIKNSISNDNEYIKNKEIKDMLIEAFIFSELYGYDKPLKYYDYALFSDEAVKSISYLNTPFLKDYFILWVSELFGKDELISIKEVREDDPEYSTIGIIYKDFVFILAFSRGKVGCFRFYYHTEEGLKKSLGKELNFYWLMGYYFNLSYQDKKFSIKSDKAFESNTKIGIFDRVMWEHSVFYDLYDPKETPKTMPSLFSKLLGNIETEEEKAKRKERKPLEPKKDFKKVSKKDSSSAEPPQKKEDISPDSWEGKSIKARYDLFSFKKEGKAYLFGIYYNGIIAGFRCGAYIYVNDVYRRSKEIYVFYEKVLRKNIEYGNFPKGESIDDINGTIDKILSEAGEGEDGVKNTRLIIPDDSITRTAPPKYKKDPRVITPDDIDRGNMYKISLYDPKEFGYDGFDGPPLLDFLNEFYPLSEWQVTEIKYNHFKVTITSDNIAKWATEFGKIHFGYCIPHSKNSITYYYRKDIFAGILKTSFFKPGLEEAKTPSGDNWSLKMFNLKYKTDPQMVAYYGIGGDFKTDKNNKIEISTYGKKISWNDHLEPYGNLTRSIDW